MTALAIDLLREVSDAGGTVRLEGDMLRLSAPEPLPDDLRARLRQHKAEIVALLSAAEPANDARRCRRGDQVARTCHAEIADGVRAILSADGAQGMPPQRWPQMQRDTRSWSKAAGCTGPRPRLDRGRPVRLRPPGAVAPARPRRARPAARRA